MGEKNNKCNNKRNEIVSKFYVQVQNDYCLFDSHNIVVIKNEQEKERRRKK